MLPMQPIKNLNSSDSYLSAIHYIRRIEKKVESAEQGNPSIDFQEQVQAVLDFQAAIKARTAQGGIPLHLQNVHRLLEETLQELSIRVETVSRKLGVSSSQLSIEEKKDRAPRSTPWAQISLGCGLAGAAALFYGLFWPAKPTKIEPQPGTDQKPSAEDDGKTPDSSEGTSEPVPEKQSDIISQDQNSNQPDTMEVRNDGERARAFTTWHPEIFGEGAKTRPTHILHEKENVNPIAGHVRDLAILLGLFFARHALNSAAPMLGLAVAHRLYHLAGLSGTAKELKKLMPQLADGMEKAANIYSGFEAILPVSTSAMLESMTSIDIWAVVGFMDLVRNVPGVQGAVAPVPFLSFFVNGRAWNLIKFSPFLIPLLNENKSEINLLLENTTRSDQADDKIIASYSRDLANLFYIYLTLRALNTAAPMLIVTAVHRAYEIIRLCNVTEELRPNMPLLVDRVEKISSLYSRISGMLPFSFSNMLESLTNMNAWAMVGLMDLVRNMLGVPFLTGHIPFLHSLHSDWRWKIFRFAPLLLAGVLPQALLGHNFQALLPR